MSSFEVWAPIAGEVSLILFIEEGKKEISMEKREKGYFFVDELNIPPEIDYLYKIDNKNERPDPKSKWQPYGVHRASRTVNTQNFLWTDQHWKGIPLKNMIIYELHVGTFTKEGTFEAVISKLPYLKELGITAIELMPISSFPGERNWGYDGTYPYAPHAAYGGPYGLQKLINACHQEGLAVILDVVYNHLGPEGNYLSEFGFYFTDHYNTPWGKAINFDGPHSDPVREFFIENALYWLKEYHFDALRLDAIHTIYDFGARHFLEELHSRFEEHARLLNRQAYLIAESDLNDARIIHPLEKGGYAIDAQWNDDFHHAIHTLLTKDRHSYFIDFGTMQNLVKSIQEGFIYNGIYSHYREKTFGNSSKGISGEKFVTCVQNHDQVGNGSEGKRLSHLVDCQRTQLAAAILLCSPSLPLIFMGQEWNATTPFYFFTSFEDEVISKNVTEGRIKEHALANGICADPQNPQSFLESKLSWNEQERPEQSTMLSLYKRLIALRKKHACFSNCRKDLTQTLFSEEKSWLIMKREDPDGSQGLIIANFSDKPQTIPISFQEGLWQSCLSEDEQTIQGPLIKKLLLSPSGVYIFVNHPTE